MKQSNPIGSHISTTLLFRRLVIRRALPQYEVSAYLMLVDKSAKCPTDGLNRKFQLVKEDKEVKDSKKRVSVLVSETPDGSGFDTANSLQGECGRRMRNYVFRYIRWR